MAVAACVWVTDTFARGITALCFCMATAMSSMLLSDARQWLTRARSASPIALEDGTAVPPTPTTANAEADAEAPAVAAKPTLISKLISFVFCTYFFVRNLFVYGVVSHDRPVLENFTAAALYILRGFEVLFTALLVLGFVAWLKKKRSDGVAEPEVAVDVPAAPVEVLFDDGVVDEKDLLKAEKKA
jgi:hypothetical protein